MRFKLLITMWVSILFLLVINNADAKEKITVAFGEVLAPWVLSDSNRGILVDMFEAAMVPLGYEIEYLYLPYARRTKAYIAGDVDISSDMNLNTINEYELQGFLSDIAYSYKNFAFSLRKNNYKFSQLSDLENQSLLSWQDAAVHLGKAYAEMVNNHPQYAETFDQSNQVKMLFLERYEVIQMDAHIFAYYRAKLAKSSVIDVSQQVDRFALFGASDNGFLFKSEKYGTILISNLNG
ncbi:transporter substrate-binding domain-containing protein [uncultured Paraglaciecola sp.]|uniref:transporter substrate-binding domain-containing protein n=1 Tax=uncultured Paraglaciecola sp. TaxID=1765024 RepID=UPI0026118C4A|nr:transporter substrate-binding domain-containing protein [uncultured Paraglaciecola sp.]